MLILPIKRKWFDMILSGEKKEEYRDIKPYYDTRLMDAFGMIWVGDELIRAPMPELQKNNVCKLRAHFRTDDKNIKVLKSLKGVDITPEVPEE